VPITAIRITTDEQQKKVVGPKANVTVVQMKQNRKIKLKSTPHNDGGFNLGSKGSESASLPKHMRPPFMVCKLNAATTPSSIH
jgi:hypothetical protein